MTVRRPLLVAVLAAVLVLAVVALIGVTGGTGGPGRSDAPPTGSSSTATAANGQESRGAGGVPGASDAAAPAGDPTTSPDPSTAPDSSGSSTSPDTGSEQPVREVAEHSGSTGDGLPGLRKAARAKRASEAELAESFPTLQSRRGTLAPDHPRRTVPLPASARVRSSSLATEDGTTQVGLVFRTPGSVGRALRFYRMRLGRVGFTEVVSGSTAGDSVSFRRRPDTVVVNASRAGEGVLVTVFATLRTGG